MFDITYKYRRQSCNLVNISLDFLINLRIKSYSLGHMQLDLDVYRFVRLAFTQKFKLETKLIIISYWD